MGKNNSNLKEERMVISGMHCRSCEMLIKDELTDLGVKRCEVDHKSGKAVILYDESKVNLDSIKSAIMKQGYRVV